MLSIQSRPRQAPRLLPELAANIRPAKEAAARPRKHVGRFQLYVVLEAVSHKGAGHHDDRRLGGLLDSL